MIARSKPPAASIPHGTGAGRPWRNEGQTMSEQVEPISAALRISHYSTLGVDEHATQAQIRVVRVLIALLQTLRQIKRQLEG